VTEEELEEIIEKARIDRTSTLNLYQSQIYSLPESIGSLTNLVELNINNNLLDNLPESIGNLVNLNRLYINFNRLTKLPESIGDLINLNRLDLSFNSLVDLPDSFYNIASLTSLCLSENQFTNLSERLGNFTNLAQLDLDGNKLTFLPDSIGSLTNLVELNLYSNQLITLPRSITNLVNLINLDLYYNEFQILPKGIERFLKLKFIGLRENALTDLSILQSLPELDIVNFLDVDLPRRYWTKLSDWNPKWLLDEENAEIRQVLIQQIGYDRICQELDVIDLNTWREYTLLKIDADIDEEPMVLLKMTCPSTGHIHILRVPPEMTSAEAAITWVNHRIHPDEFTVQT
jgi:leucine-rich repeat protein SHOC2